MNENLAPRVFVSYSHDSPYHMRWVSELCSRLRLVGINIIFDQWDLSPGEDITKFMEDGLTSSDRVLIICTDQYVRKADAGEGGVAYERMIVTAELIQNLGTQKFIPIIRQDTEKPILPKFMGARFYINLSQESTFAEGYDRLIRELHKVPAVPKPPLGKNPFAKQPSGVETPTDTDTSVPLKDLSIDGKEVSSIYDTALEIARQGDLVAWRRLVKEVRHNLPIPLQKWREERKLNDIRDEKDLPQIMDEAVAIYARLFAVSLAGIQSGREKFVDQRAVIDELASPPGWKGGVYAPIVRIPRGLVFAFQALYGATSLDTNQLELMVPLALMKIAERGEVKPYPLIYNHDVIGWPESLGHNCKSAWAWLVEAGKRWPWLPHVFADDEDYKVALHAYYMSLSILELAMDIQAGHGEALRAGSLRLDVPVCFLYDEAIFLRACQHLMRSNPKMLWESQGVSMADMKKFWPIWVGAAERWLPSVYGIWDEVPMAYRKFFEDLA